MIDGHPYFTAELDGQRSRQRRLLSELPDWLVSRLYPPLNRHSEGQSCLEALTNRPRLEYAFRHLADAEAESLSDLLAVATTPFHVDDLRKFVHDRMDDWEGLDIGRILHKKDDPSHDLYTKLHEQSTEMKAMRRMLAFLVWADQLAGDYRDQRIPEA